MRQDRSSDAACNRLSDVKPAMGAGEEQGDELSEDPKAQEHPADIPLAGAEPSRPGPLWTVANCREPGDTAEPVRSSHPEFRTEVTVGEVTVTGVLPGTARPRSIAIGGDVHRLSCDQALELADALLLVVMRMDIVAEERCRRDHRTCDREA
jgi:hypothetical protein